MATPLTMTTRVNTAPGGKTSDSWRLSRIDEELDKLHFSTRSDNRTPASLPVQQSRTLPRKTTHTAWDNDIYGMADMYNSGQLCNNSSSTPNLDNTSDIYSKAVIKPAYSGDKILDSRQAVKAITGKYDSLGRMKPSLAPLCPPPPPLLQSNSGDQSPDNFGSADFPPPPPEGFAMMDSPEACRNTASPPFVVDRSPVVVTERAPVRAATLPRCELPREEHRDTLPQYQQDDHMGYVPALTEQETLQVEMFYRSHKTEVFVCQSLANMYFGNIRGSVSSTQSSCMIESGHWQFFKSGVPVLVLDSGQSRRKRKLHIILTERGTGFTLWKDSMNHLTNYASPQSTFHTMHLSNDHTKLAGFRFVDAAAAVDFYHKIFKLVSDPNDDILNLSGTKGKKKAKSKEKDKKKYKAPTKADISTPCCFTHITKLDRTDGAASGKDSTPPQRSLPSSPLHPNSPRVMTNSFT